MFTGIVEEIGRVKKIEKGKNSLKISIEASKVLKNTKIGDSICTNGVCLTVTNISNSDFEADVMGETLYRSGVGNLDVGSFVNLERAVAVGDRLDGHIVSGHIDGIGEIASIVKNDNATWIEINLSEKLLKYVIEKGSISIDGISLTVAYVYNKSFEVSIIPHTGEETILTKKKVGEVVNIECDMIGKYVEKLLGLDNKNLRKEKINKSFLKENGFL